MISQSWLIQSLSIIESQHVGEFNLLWRLQKVLCCIESLSGDFLIGDHWSNIREIYPFNIGWLKTDWSLNINIGKTENSRRNWSMEFCRTLLWCYRFSSARKIDRRNNWMNAHKASVWKVTQRELLNWKRKTVVKGIELFQVFWNSWIRMRGFSSLFLAIHCVDLLCWRENDLVNDRSNKESTERLGFNWKLGSRKIRHWQKNQKNSLESFFFSKTWTWLNIVVANEKSWTSKWIFSCVRFAVKFSQMWMFARYTRRFITASILSIRFRVQRKSPIWWLNSKIDVRGVTLVFKLCFI